MTIFRLIAAQMTVFCLFFISMNSYANSQFESRESIYKAAREFVKARMSKSYELDLKMGYLDKRLKLVKCKQALSAFFPARKHNLGATSVGVRCTQPNWKVFVPVQIKAYKNIVTISQSLPRGSVLQEKDLRIEKREISRFRSGVFSKKKEVVGMIIRHAVAGGVVLTPRLVQPRQLVKRGQNVTILAESGGLMIRVNGEALMDGHQGQTVQVKNLRSGKRFSAEVVAPHTVRVKM